MARFNARRWCSRACKVKKLSIFGVWMTVRELAEMIGKKAAYVEASLANPRGWINRLVQRDRT